jgi:hypothetical protein
MIRTTEAETRSFSDSLPLRFAALPSISPFPSSRVTDDTDVERNDEPRMTKDEGNPDKKTWDQGSARRCSRASLTAAPECIAAFWAVWAPLRQLQPGDA